LVTVPESIARYAIALTAAALIAATLSCALSDEVPPPDAEKQARIAQVAELLQAAGSGRGAESGPLIELLESLTRFPPAERASRALAQTLVEGLRDAPMSATASERVARNLYNLMNGGYLKRSDLEVVTLAIEKELVTAGVSAAAAAAARQAGIRVAREPRNPRADWW
jgi:hypothetical protein